MKSQIYLRGTALTGLLLALALCGWQWRRAHPPALSAGAVARLRAHTPPGMAPVPGGYCLIGSNDPDAEDDVKPMRRVYVPSFYIDAHEVTNAEYRKFDPTHDFAPAFAQLPATDITYAQAEAYAHWAGKRLPTEEEWEKAARGTDGRRYPWGNDWDPRRVAPRAHRGGFTSAAVRPLQPGHTISCNLGPPRVQPVGSIAAGRSPYGCYDMAGNAWEWVQGNYNDNPDQRILRGGAVGYGETSYRTYARGIEGSADT